MSSVDKSVPVPVTVPVTVPVPVHAPKHNSKKTLASSEDNPKTKSRRHNSHHRKRESKEQVPTPPPDARDVTESKVNVDSSVAVVVETHEDDQKSTPDIEPVSDVEILSIMPPCTKKQTSRRGYPFHNKSSRDIRPYCEDDEEDDDYYYGGVEEEEEEEDEGEILDISSEDSSESLWNIGNDLSGRSLVKSEIAELQQERLELLKERVLLRKERAYYEISLVKMKGCRDIKKAKEKLDKFVRRLNTNQFSGNRGYRGAYQK